MKLNQHHNRVTTPFGDIQFDVDNLFDQVFGNRVATNGNRRGDWVPRVSIIESDQCYEMMLELAGVDPESVNVELHDNQLDVSGNKELPELTEGFKALRDERVSGEFRRSFEFAKQIDGDKIEATFRHGTLHIQLPKSEAVLPRKIKVKVAE